MKIKKLIEIIENDIKNAELNRACFLTDSEYYKLYTATIYTLKTVLFDMRELKMIK